MRPILFALALSARAEPAAEFIYGHVSARQGEVMTVTRGDDESQGRVRVQVRFADIVFPMPRTPFALHRAIMVVLHGADADGTRRGDLLFGGKNVNGWRVLKEYACPAENTDEKNMPGLLRGAVA